MRQVALLRGVNLGKRQVIMSELRAICESAGFIDVRTLLASGNLVLSAKEKGAKLEAKLEKLLLDEMGLRTDVFVRTAAELQAVVVGNPFKSFAKKQPTFMVVTFAREKPTAAEFKAMVETSTGGEQVAIGKGCIYSTFPNGQSQSEMKRITYGTSRNWNTVTKLSALLAD